MAENYALYREVAIRKYYRWEVWLYNSATGGVYALNIYFCHRSVIPKVMESQPLSKE
jgi:hypothetical protein